jgi:UDP-N-acetylglucosamine acyltransferase
MIHSSAIVDPKANIGDSVDIGPFVVIGEGVKLAMGQRFMPIQFLKGPGFLLAKNAK